jgi:hypothetical protein
MDSRLRLLSTAVTLSGALLVANCADTSGAGGTTVGSTTAAMATTTTATGMGGSGNRGGSPSTGGMGGEPEMGGFGGTDTCADQGDEPNDTMATATQRPGSDDCDDPMLSTSGTIDGPDDVDWFMAIQTDDVAGCVVEPGRSWSQQGGQPIRVCKYVECSINNMPPSSVDCNDGSTPDEQGGVMGCCGTVPFTVGIGGLFESGCPTTNDLLNVWTRIDMPNADPDTCTAYNLNYHF